MVHMRLLLDGEGIAAEKDPAKCHHIQNLTIATLDGGMQSGKPSVAFVFDLPNGEWVLAETSLALFQSAAKAFTAKFGDVSI